MNIGDLKKLIEYLKDDTELVLMQFGNGNKKDCMLLIDDFGIAESKEEALRLEKEWLESECDTE